MNVLSRRKGVITPVPSAPSATASASARSSGLPSAYATSGTVPIAEVVWRQRARVAGRVRSLRIQPWGGVPTLECTLVDHSGGLVVVFLGRRAVAGVVPGRKMAVSGMVGAHHGHLAILNPDYELLAPGTE